MFKKHIFRTALVGCGRISAINIAALKAIPDVDIVAVCDLNDKLAHAQAVRHNIPSVYTDMERMMSKVRPDVVHLLTPPRTHVALAQIAAKHQAHIYVEKPLASSAVDARSILEAAQKAGVHLCPGHSLLF